MSDALRIGLTTCDSKDAAASLARGLVEAGLAACVQIEAGLCSIYEWQGQLEQAQEWRLMVKFPARKSAEVEAWIEAHHPYDLPEWVVLCPEHVSPRYLEWATR